MLRRIDLTCSLDGLRQVLPRAHSARLSADAAVAPILADVAARGSAAVLAAGEQFDGLRPATLRVPQSVLDAALADLAPSLHVALEEMISRVKTGHAAQLPQPVRTELADGAVVQQRWIPVHRVGLYVPGGLAVYPSTVVMNAIPAQTAQVDAIAVCSPPQANNDGWPDPVVLAACALLGIDEVYAAGGAQAIGLLAYGDDDAGIEPVDVITGPGNAYVTAAKRLVRDRVAIDAEAGPTEIAIIADRDANATFVALDLISQAEHDELAAAVLITDSVALADAVDEQLAAWLAITRHTERISAALSGCQSAAIVVADLDAAIAVANAYAAEHLEIHTRDPEAVAAGIRHAGAIFVGPYSPVPLGDYCAGSNHVLPTAGTARYASGLNVTTFLKCVQQVSYTASALAAVAPAIAALAEAENLPAHGQSVAMRFIGDGAAAVGGCGCGTCTCGGAP